MAAGIPLDELQIDIVVNAAAASTSLKNLADNLHAVSSAGKGLGTVSQDIKKMGSAATEAAGQTAKAGDAIKSTGDSAAQTSKSLSNTTQNLKEMSQKGEQTSRTITKVSKEVKEAGKQANKSAGFFSNFIHSVGRIAMYRLIRSAIRLVTQAITEGFKAFIAWDREQNNFGAGAANAVDQLTAKWGQLKGQIGALAGTLITSLAPVISFIIDALTKMVDILQMVIRSLQGEKTYFHAIYKDAKATTGAAKELKRVLFGFDELNILPSKSGGGLSTESGAWDYEELPINSKFLNGIADASEGLQQFFGYSEDAQKGIGGLVGIMGVLLGGKAIGGLLRLLPSLIGGFNRKTQALGNQTTATQAETSAVKALVPAFAMALGAATAFGLSLKKNPAVVTSKVQSIVPGISSAFSAAKSWLSDKVLTFSTAVQSVTSNVKSVFNDAKGWLADKVLTISTGLSNNFNSLVGTLASWIQSLQGYANSNPIILPVYEQMMSSSTPVSAGVSAGSMSANPNTQGGYLTHGKSNKYQYTGASAVSVGSNVSAATPKGSLTTSGYNALLWINQQPTSSLKSLQQLANLEIPEPIYNEVYWVADYNRLDNVKNWLNGVKHANIPMNPKYGKTSSSFLTALMTQISQMFGMMVGVPGFASGGLIPNTGSLFLAGESGAEVVADMGSHTGVMNVDQMQQAVASGNIDVVNAIYAMSNMVVNAVNNKNFDIYMDSAKVGKSVTAYQSNQARRGLVQGAM